jgi:hypothetical protein
MRPMMIMIAATAGKMALGKVVTAVGSDNFQPFLIISVITDDR